MIVYFPGLVQEFQWKSGGAKEDLLAQLPYDHDHDGPTISNHTWSKMSILFHHQTVLFIKV